MALYYRFKSAKQFSEFPICDRYISIGEFKDRIFESKIGRGRDFDLVITNAVTNEDYVDESTLIPANSRLLIRRIPGWPKKPIVVGAPVPVPVEGETEFPEKPKLNQDTVKRKEDLIQDSEWDEFFASNSMSSSSTLTTVDAEESKIQSPALECKQETASNGRSGDGMRGRMKGRNIPPEGYLCRRCNVAGHFIQHCPTNGDPDYDVKKVKAPRGIPKSMLISTPDGLYGLPDGKVAVFSPDDATFQKQVEGMPSTRCSVADIPRQLYCKLCEKIMEYAVMTSKCCFDSFCDQCIRNYIISNSSCVCGAKDILADHLVPNFTLRNAIDRIMESNNCGTHNNNGHKENALQIPHANSHNPQAKVRSPGQSLKPKIEASIPSLPQSVSSKKEENAVTSTKDVAVQEASVSEASNKAEDVDQEVPVPEASKNDEFETTKEPSDVGEMQWSAAQNLAANNYMRSMAFTAYNPYWDWTAGIQPGVEGFMPHGPYAGIVPYMCFGVGPMNTSSGTFLPQEQCSVPQMMRGREFQTSRAAPKRKHESLKEHDRDISRRDISSKKFKTNHQRFGKAIFRGSEPGIVHVLRR